MLNLRFLLSLTLLLILRCTASSALADSGATRLSTKAEAFISSAEQPRLSLQFGHDLGANKVAVSPDGQWLATGDGMGVVKLWKLETGDLWWTLPAASQGTESLVFSPDSLFLAIGRGPDGVKLLEVATGRLSRIISPRKEAEKALMFPVAFSPDGKLLWLAQRAGQLQARRISTGAIEKQWKTMGRFLALSGNASVAATIDGTGALHLWNLATGKRQRTLFKRPFVYGQPTITAAAFTLDGTQIVTGSYEGQIQLWNVATGQQIPLAALHRHILTRPLFGDLPQDSATPSSEAVTSMAFSQDGHTLVVGVGAHPDLEQQPVSYAVISSATNPDTAEGTTTAIEPRGDSILAVAITPDGRTLISADDEATIRLWDASTRRITRTLARSAEEPNVLAFAPGGQTLVTSAQYGPARLWDLRTGQMVQALTEDPQRRSRYVVSPTVLSMAPNGSYLATGDLNGLIQLWGGQPRKLVATLRGSDEEITSLTFSADSRTLASGSNEGLVRLWQATTSPTTPKRPFSLRKTLRANDENFDPVVGLGFVRGDTLIATLGQFGPMRLWNLKDYRLTQELPLVGEDSPGAFSLDGRYYAQGLPGKIEVWNMLTCRLQRRLIAAGDYVTQPLFTPDGSSLLASVWTSSGPSQIKKWDLETGKVRTLSKHWPGDASALAFSPDGKRLALCTPERPVQLWDAVKEDLIVSFAMLPAQEDLQLSENWIAFTPSGNFQASAHAGDFIRWRMGDNILPFSAYSAKYLRPDFVQQALQQQ